MAYFETGGLNFWEILGLAILFIWAVNRYFRKRNEADDEKAAMFPGAMDLRQPMGQRVSEEFDHIEYFEEETRRWRQERIDEALERDRRYCHTGRFD
jgi:hypothetical protein